jgi:predicted amidohydrolase
MGARATPARRVVEVDLVAERRPAHVCEQADMQHVRTAMCQTLCLAGDREGNFVRVEHALKKSRELGAQIACFPETCLLGWVNPDAHQRAHPIPSGDPAHDISRLRLLAQQYGLMIAAGLAEKYGDRLYDSAVLIDSDGTLLLKYRKRNHLPELKLMTPPYAVGAKADIVATRYGKLGMLICADTFIESYLHELRDLRPDLVLVPYGWAAIDEQWPAHGEELAKVVRSAAQTIGAPVVGVNSVGAIAHGPWLGRTYGGQSIASDEQGNVLGVAADRDVDVLSVDVTLRP